MTVIEHGNREKPIMGIVAYADDFVVSSDNVEADRVWDETTMALGEIGLEIDQSKSCCTSKEESSWRHTTLTYKKVIVVLGTESTEWNLTVADEMDATLAQKRLDEAYIFAGHFEAVAQMHLDTRKSEGLWLMTSKSIARALDFDAKVVHPEEDETLGKKTGR